MCPASCPYLLRASLCLQYDVVPGLGLQAFFKTLAALALLVLTAQSFGMAISASAPSLKAAQIMAPISTVILMLFGGFYVGVDSLWDGWVFLEAISFMQYCYVQLFDI